MVVGPSDDAEQQVAGAGDRVDLDDFRDRFELPDRFVVATLGDRHRGERQNIESSGAGVDIWPVPPDGPEVVHLVEPRLHCAPCQTGPSGHVGHRGTRMPMQQTDQESIGVVESVDQCVSHRLPPRSEIEQIDAYGSILVADWAVLLPMSTQVGELVKERPLRQRSEGVVMASHMKRVDHITYACDKGKIEQWAWFHIEVEGGTLINRIDDVRPDDLESSMKIWCVDFGEFGIALIEGIDRAQKSQVSLFVERHGDHSCQHVAYDTHDLDKFTVHMKSLGGTPRGNVLVRNDGFGVLKQMFARGYAEGNAAEATFPEYVQRPSVSDSDAEVAITFAEETGRGFYDQIEDAVAAGDEDPFFDFTRMPTDWQVPAATPLEGFRR